MSFPVLVHEWDCKTMLVVKLTFRELMNEVKAIRCKSQILSEWRQPLTTFIHCCIIDATKVVSAAASCETMPWTLNIRRHKWHEKIIHSVSKSKIYITASLQWVNTINSIRDSIGGDLKNLIQLNEFYRFLKSAWSSVCSKLEFDELAFHK